MKRKNVIFERTRFNRRKQEEGKLVDDFIIDLYCRSEHCRYGALQNEMIHNWIIIGLHIAALFEKLQMDPDLKLDKAIKTARESESIKRQQTLLRTDFWNEWVVDTLVKQPLKSKSPVVPRGSQQKALHPDNLNHNRSLPRPALGAGDPLSTGRKHAKREETSRLCAALMSVNRWSRFYGGSAGLCAHNSLGCYSVIKWKILEIRDWYECRRECYSTESVQKHTRCQY